MAVERQILFHSRNITVVNTEHGSETVFVTFNEVDRTASGAYFWGASAFDDIGVSAIGFVSADKNWYPPADMTAALDVVKQQIGTRRVVTYGFSQGGYGALKFGSRLSASLALGFSTQWSINPDDVSDFDNRFIHYYDKALQGGSRIEAHDLCPRNFIFADPGFTTDMMNAKRLIALSNVTLIPVPFVKHGTVRLITEGGLSRRLITRCLHQPDVEAAELRALLRSGRARSPMYQRGLIARLLREGRRHQHLLEKALKAIPDGPGKTMLLVAGHDAVNQRREAQAALDSLDDDALLTVDLQKYWTLFRASGFAEGEARLAPLIEGAQARR